MRTRITIAMVVILVVALALAGTISFILVRNADKQNAVSGVLAQATTTADEIKNTSYLDGLNLNLLSEILYSIGQIAGDKSAGILVVSNNHLEDKLPDGINVSDLNMAQLEKGKPISGAIGNLAFAVAPYSVTKAAGGKVISSILLINQIAFSYGSVKYFTLAGLIALLVAVVGTLYTTKRISNHVVRAAKAANAIASGDLDTRITRSKGDYPELILLEAAINTMAEKVSQSRQLERQFLLSISHDLRTPLTSIRGFAEAIADNVAPDPSKAAEVLVAESSRLERLIRDLLDLAYLEARRFSLRLDVMDAVSCVQQTATSFTMEARQSMVDITFYADQDTILALADGDRLSQVVANLIQNALKFTKSKIVIMVSDSINPLLVENQSYKNSALYKNYGKKKYFYIHVEDDGLGIAEEDLPHVFERLYTSDRRVLREGKGTGLGLAIVKELIEAMGGEVFVTSPVENNRGTVFIVALECYEPTSEEG